MTSAKLGQASAAAVAGLMALSLGGGTVLAQGCGDLPGHRELSETLSAVVDGGGNGGLGNEMWATVINRNGVVCAVAFTGEDRGDQWPGSRVISAQKANTANAFSLPSDAGFGGALSSGNLYGTVLPEGSLLGLQFSNPVDTSVAYKGPGRRYGQRNDPMVGNRIGGVNVFGGGLALYVDGEEVNEIVGGLGVSGDTSCTDHVVAWKVRDALELDFVPGGVSPSGDDNLILASPPFPNSFQHPICGTGEARDEIIEIINDLPFDFPIGPNP